MDDQDRQYLADLSRLENEVALAVLGEIERTISVPLNSMIGDALHRARQSMGEWLLRELQFEAAR